jgi:hypothetical protein
MEAGSVIGRAWELYKAHWGHLIPIPIPIPIPILLLVTLSFGLVDRAIDYAWVGVAIDIVSQTLTAPFLALAWTLTYYELRGQKEAVPAPVAV